MIQLSCSFACSYLHPTQKQITLLTGRLMGKYLTMLYGRHSALCQYFIALYICIMCTNALIPRQRT